MIPAYRKRTIIAGFVSVAAFIAVALVAGAANPREPGVGTKAVSLLAAGGGAALLCTVWFYIKAKGRSGWWMLVLALSFVGLVILAFLKDLGTAGEGGNVQKGAWRQRASRVLLSSAQLIVALVAVFCIYGGWMWWEGRQLKSLCAEANEGVAVAALPALAEKYGFDQRWVRHGIQERNGAGWVAYVPSRSTIGEVACAIHYNETKVLSARIGP